MVGYELIRRHNAYLSLICVRLPQARSFTCIKAAIFLPTLRAARSARPVVNDDVSTGVDARQMRVDEKGPPTFPSHME